MPDIELVWSKVVNGTCYAWFWSEYYDHCFRIIVLKSKGIFVEDKSFFIYDDKENICGLVPLVFIKSSNYNGIEASYDKPLPWPMIMDHVQNSVLIIEFIFTKIDTLLREANAIKISMEYSPPDYKNNFGRMFSEVMRKYKYIDNSFMSHCLNISNDTLGGVRKRYKRYVKKYSHLYLLNIINKDDVNIDVIRKYMELHVKDSGALHRPLKTYVAQFEYIVKGNGFIVQAKNKETDDIVGMLMICISKKSAYDGSVAVDPDYKQHFISHLMKWKAIQYLADIDVRRYELGIATESNNYLTQSPKKITVYHFLKMDGLEGSLRKL